MLALYFALLAAPATPSEALRSLEDREWAWRLEESPMLATAVGVHTADDRLDRVDASTQQRHLQHWREIAREVDAIPRDALSQAERVDESVLAEQVRASIAGIELRAYLLPLNGDSSFYSDLAQLPRRHLFRDAADYEKYIQRLRDIPRYFDENIELMREGLQAGITAPQVILKGRDQAARVQA